jgi:ferredoxin
MPVSSLPLGSVVSLAGEDFQQVLDALRRRGYRVIGPTLANDNLVYVEILAVTDLPRGWTDEQEAGAFRLKPRGDQALFGYGVGQQSWKQFLFPSGQLLWQARRTKAGFRVIPPPVEDLKFAFIGVHACDLHALAVQDRVFLKGKYVDPSYRQRRTGALIIAVNCTQACGTGFCASLGTGPKAASGFDLALTEVCEDKEHYFLAEVGTPLGAQILAEIPLKPAGAGEIEAATCLVAKAALNQGRVLDPVGLKELLYRNYEHPRWDQVAARCLSCGNCTLVCPTCFCHTIDDITDLTGAEAERRRRWDSCFTVDFSYLHGGSVRTSALSRYRQWLTHKLATWQDQFGCLGCVGCGRCLTWCPVAIDLTEEVRAIRQTETSPKEKQHGSS